MFNDWNAAQYHKLSDPQTGWGLRVLERLKPLAGECILDIGCGTGRLTSQIAARVQQSVTAVDRSWTMLSEASRHFGSWLLLAQADGTRLPFREMSFDAVFSTATFHWIKDHDMFFGEVYRVLKPGGRLVSQGGGGPNLQALYERARHLRSSGEYAPYFTDWSDPWNFAASEETTARMANAGFVAIEVDLEPAQTPFDDIAAYEEFVTTVCLRHHIERLPEPLRYPFVHELALVAAADDPPLTLDYWRLNADGRRP